SDLDYDVDENLGQSLAIGSHQRVMEFALIGLLIDALHVEWLPHLHRTLFGNQHRAAYGSPTRTRWKSLPLPSSKLAGTQLGFRRHAGHQIAAIYVFFRLRRKISVGLQPPKQYPA